ncbi:MAG: hypothetical protein MHPSP_001653, partial [Paramarteilia canceri]
NKGHYEIMFEKTVNVDGKITIKNADRKRLNYIYNYYFDEVEHKYKKCPVGKENDYDALPTTNTCTKCSVHYKYVNTNSGLICKKCPDKTFARIVYYDESSRCSFRYDNYHLKSIFDYDFFSCDYPFENSIGRKENTPPFFDYCQCPNNMPRVKLYNSLEKKDKFDCLSRDLQLKHIDPNGLDYAVLNTVFISDIEYIEYRNCNPYRDFKTNLIDLCLCPREQVYSDGKCKSCSDSDMIDPKIQVKCSKCTGGKILTLNGKGCMCPYSDDPQSNDCEEATENEKICSGNLVLSNGKCIPCSKNQIISKTTDECVCPKGKYINKQNICVECQKGEFSNLSNATECIKCGFFKTTVGTNSNTELQCNKNNYINIAIIIGMVMTILLIFAVITIFIVGKKPKHTNESNQYIIEAVIEQDQSKNS